MSAAFSAEQRRSIRMSAAFSAEQRRSIRMRVVDCYLCARGEPVEPYER